jgi:hypothetical protein
MSAADIQVVVQTPDPRHRPTDQLDLPAQALRRHGPATVLPDLATGCHRAGHAILAVDFTDVDTVFLRRDEGAPTGRGWTRDGVNVDGPRSWPMHCR